LYTLDIAALSDAGLKRERNEDSWSGPPPNLPAERKTIKGQLYVVADGVGGHLAGELASKLATETIQQHYYADPAPDVTTSLPAAIRAADERICQEAGAKLKQHGMSTTITAAVLRGDQLTIANVGDSRAYLIRQGRARQATVDHSWVEEQIQFGLITREEAAHHPHRNIITRSLGSNAELQIDTFEERVEPGDGVLLCSDGLSNMVADQELADLASQDKSANIIVHELVELAKQRGAPDNVTVILLKTSPMRGPRAQNLLARGILTGFILLLIGILLLWMLSQAKKDQKSSALATSSVAKLSVDVENARSEPLSSRHCC
jgi:protein phosphatase